MKIALCYESMIPKLGGCETYLADLARYLTDDDHEVHLFTTRFDIDSFSKSVVPHLLPASKGLRFLRPWQFASACYQALQSESFDVSVGFIKTWGQDVLMPQGGFHVASVEHNIRKHPSALLQWLVRTKNLVDPRNWSFRLLERRQLFDFPSVVVVPSKMVQRHGLEHYQLAEGRMRVVHNAIDSKRFPNADRLVVRSQMRDQCRLLPEDNVGLFVGHNYRLKGLIPLFHAIKLLPKDLNFRLLICGSEHYQRFEKLARSMGISDSVRFLGFHPDVREAFFTADFLIHPSFYDPCALVTMEALSCGLPVITTKLNGGSELLPPELATLTIDTPHDHAAMARQIVRLCVPSERMPLARIARDAAKAWTFSDHYGALMSIFEEVARSKRPSVAVTRPGLVS